MMILLLTLFLIVFEAIGEALIKKHCPKLSLIIFKWWLQWIIAIGLFLVWLVIVLNLNYVPVWKLIIGFVFVRFLVFDVVWNIVRGVKWNYYGTTKLYDRLMVKLGSFGWFMKVVCGIVGIVFLMGIE